MARTCRLITEWLAEGTEGLQRGQRDCRGDRGIAEGTEGLLLWGE